VKVCPDIGRSPGASTTGVGEVRCSAILRGYEGMSTTTQDLKGMNLHGFYVDMEELRKEVYQTISEEDFRHLKRVEWYGRIASIFGYLTAWIIVNPISAFGMSLGQFTRWLIAHHVTHRGYDKVLNIPDRYTSKNFARGWRRFIDWFDWIHPSAWDYEHNILHHYNTGEDKDPDVAERHTEYLRQLPLPKFIKYCILFLVATSWKITYYAPNTMSVLEPQNGKRIRSENIVFLTFKNIFDFSSAQVMRLWMVCYLPYGLFHFLIVPLLFLPLGEEAVMTVFFNKILAEIFTNLHSFIVIGPNHTADDLYRFDYHYDDRAEFYVNQVLGSANYTCGTEVVDYLSIWLNYQIEHHLFPDLPMLKYREIQPRVKELCKRHNIPYRQENIFKRLKRMADVCVGKTSMIALQRFPREELERAS
jgi:fatty acid desaturase